MKKGLVFIFGIVLILIPGFVSGICGDGVCEVGEDSSSCETDCLDMDFGINFGYFYGGDSFINYIQDLNIHLTKIYIFWEQIESTKGNYDWTIIDNFLNQLNPGDEASIAVWANAGWQRSTNCLTHPRGSKPTDTQAYYDFIYGLVLRSNGKVKYWQNDVEPNSPNMWCGTSQEFIDTLQIFHQAVKDADSNAIVIVGGHDGGFDTFGNPGNQPFFDDVFLNGNIYFDWFDLRLYQSIWDNSPTEIYGKYSIKYRVDWFKNRMNSYGFEKPIVSTEYGGPLPAQFLEFEDTKAWCSNQCKSNPSISWCDANLHNKLRIRGCWLEMQAQGILPLQIDMFLDTTTPELDDKRNKIHCKDITQRLVTGMSAGVKKFWLWDLVQEDDNQDPIWGKIDLMKRDFSEKYPPYFCYQRMASKISSTTSVNKIPNNNVDISLFEVNKLNKKMFVAWENRDFFCGEEPHPSIDYPVECNGLTKPQTAFSFDAGFSNVKITDVFGNEVIKSTTNGILDLSINDTPVFIESCIHNADLDCDDIIDLPEIIDYIDRWKNNDPDVTTSSLFDALVIWKG